MREETCFAQGFLPHYSYFPMLFLKLAKPDFRNAISNLEIIQSMTINITKKSLFLGLLALGAVAATTPLIAQRATPATLTDEQQAINAVRKVKS